MSTEPSTDQHDQGHEAESHSEVTAAETAAGMAAAQAAEASKLFDKLFARNEPVRPVNSINAVSVPQELPPPIAKQDIAGETFLRKVVTDSEEHSFQRVIKTEDDSAIHLPGRFVDATQDATVPPPHRTSVEVSQPRSELVAQDIPPAVDAVVSDQVKAEIQARVKAAKYAANPEINFPVRINNLKTQNDKLRARLASLE